jgi:hypothetical protein
MTLSITSLLTVTIFVKSHSKLDNMELNNISKICYTYPSGTVEFEITEVNYQPPYQWSKWLFTQLREGHPWFSWQAENDEELYILMAKQMIGTTSINILYHDKKD